MGTHRINACFRLLLASMIAACGLMAAEHHGVLKSSGLPVPGATVTVVQATKKAVTNHRRARRIRVSRPREWCLDHRDRNAGLREGSFRSGGGRRHRASTMGVGAASGQCRVRKKAPVTEQVAATKPAAGQRPPAPTATPRNANARPGMNGRNGNSYQRLDVNAASMGVIGTNGGVSNDLNLAELNQSAADSMLVSGSVSRGLDMPMRNDWFGPGGFMPGPPGMGGPMGGPNGEPPTGAPGFSGVGPAAGMAMGGPGRGGMGWTDDGRSRWWSAWSWRWSGWSRPRIRRTGRSWQARWLRRSRHARRRSR